MVSFSRKVGPITIISHWFCKKPRRIYGVVFAEYMQCQSREDFIGFVKKPFFTKVIDLKKGDRDVLAGFSSNTRYKIHRAQRDGVQFEHENNRLAFINFFNSFARLNHISRLAPTHYVGLTNNTVISKAVHHGIDLVMHSHIIDEESGRARLLHSASCAEAAGNQKLTRLIGFANRFLHYAEMMQFKSQGIAFYDFGGYAVNTEDKKLNNINRFKDGFGGEIIEESTYRSVPLCLARIMHRGLVQ
jgi:hypothetical protein